MEIYKDYARTKEANIVDYRNDDDAFVHAKDSIQEVLHFITVRGVSEAATCIITVKRASKELVLQRNNFFLIERENKQNNLKIREELGSINDPLVGDKLKKPTR